MLKIKIKGGAGTGKTSVAHVIHKALVDAGYNVFHSDDGGGMAAGYRVYTPDPTVTRENNDGREVKLSVRE